MEGDNVTELKEGKCERRNESFQIGYTCITQPEGKERNRFEIRIELEFYSYNDRAFHSLRTFFKSADKVN